MFATKVSTESPESRATWTERINVSNGDDEIKGTEVVEVVDDIVDGKEVGNKDEGGEEEKREGACRSTRAKGSPKASSPLSRMAKQQSTEKKLRGLNVRINRTGIS